MLLIHEYINVSVGVDYTDLAEVGQKMNYHYVVKDSCMFYRLTYFLVHFFPLYIPGCPKNLSLGQASLEDPPASTSQCCD